MPSRPSSLLFVLLLALLPACSSTPTALELDIHNRQPREIWMQVVRYANTRGFRADPLETDPGRMHYQSVWSGVQQGGVMRARRTRFYAELREIEKDPPHWKVDYFVQVQRCMTPGILRPREEDWSDAGRDGGKEREFQMVMMVGLRQRFDIRKQQPDR